MFDPFNWLRRRVAESVVAGVADGLAAVTPEGDESPPNLDELRKRLASAVEPKALPAAEPEEPRKKGR